MLSGIDGPAEVPVTVMLPLLAAAVVVRCALRVFGAILFYSRAGNPVLVLSWLQDTDVPSNCSLYVVSQISVIKVTM